MTIDFPMMRIHATAPSSTKAGRAFRRRISRARHSGSPHRVQRPAARYCPSYFRPGRVASLVSTPCHLSFARTRRCFQEGTRSRSLGWLDRSPPPAARQSGRLSLAMGQDEGPGDIMRLFAEKKCVTIAAPMVRFSRLPFRHVVRSWGCDIVYTPMIMAESFAASQRARDVEMNTNAYDKPLIVQFAADSASQFAAATELLAGKVAGVDLNCGCPQQWAIKEGVGAALLKKPDTVRDMVRQARERGGGMPISVKIRTDADLKKTVHLVQNAEQVPPPRPCPAQAPSTLSAATRNRPAAARCAGRGVVHHAARANRDDQAVRPRGLRGHQVHQGGGNGAACGQRRRPLAGGRGGDPRAHRRRRRHGGARAAHEPRHVRRVCLSLSRFPSPSAPPITPPAVPYP